MGQGVISPAEQRAVVITPEMQRKSSHTHVFLLASQLLPPTPLYVHEAPGAKVHDADVSESLHS